MNSVAEFFSNNPNIVVLENDVPSQFRDIEQLEKTILSKLKNHKVCIISSEISPEIFKAIQKIKYPGVVWYLPGYINDVDVKIVPYQWHIWHVCSCNNTLSVNHLDPKKYYFDALLGTRKFHRDFVFELIKERKLTDKIFIKYHGYHASNLPLNFNEHFVWPVGDEIPELDVDNNPILTSTVNVLHNQKSVRLSCIIPENVYNQTAYSIVVETFHDNEFSFFTEKIGKPIFAKRLFVVFSGYKYLENLRRLGFKTFSGIIDESYDQVLDIDIRFRLAMDQVEWLCNQDQKTILDKIQPICEHNYNIIMSTDWARNYLDYPL